MYKRDNKKKLTKIYKEILFQFYQKCQLICTSVSLYFSTTLSDSLNDQSQLYRLTRKYTKVVLMSIDLRKSVPKLRHRRYPSLIYFITTSLSLEQNISNSKRFATYLINSEPKCRLNVGVPC